MASVQSAALAQLLQLRPEVQGSLLYVDAGAAAGLAALGAAALQGACGAACAV